MRCAAVMRSVKRILMKNGRPSALTPDFALRRKTLSCSTAGGLSASTDVLMCGDVCLGSGFPPLRDGELSFTFHVNLDGKVRYEDPYRKNSPYIPMVLPRYLPDYGGPGAKAAAE